MYWYTRDERRPAPSSGSPLASTLVGTNASTVGLPGSSGSFTACSTMYLAKNSSGGTPIHSAAFSISPGANQPGLFSQQRPRPQHLAPFSPTVSTFNDTRDI